MGFLGRDMGHLGTIWGPVREGYLEVNSRSILGQFWINTGPSSHGLSIILRFTFIWPWVGPKPQNMTKSGSWDSGGGYRYSPPRHPPSYHYPGYTLPPASATSAARHAPHPD